MNKHRFNFALPIISAIALQISSIAYSANPPSAIDILNDKLQKINTLQDKLNEKLEELRVKQSEIGQHRQQLEAQLTARQQQSQEREIKLSAQVQELQQQLTAAQGTITELTTRITTLEASTKQQTFKLGGDLMVFYPVFFQDHCYHLGNTQLTISRYIHEDVAGKGGLVVRISYHPSGWGAGADYTESLLTYSIQPFVADMVIEYYMEGVTYWLRGNTTYHYSTNCPTEPKYNLDGDLVLRESEHISGGKLTRSKRTDVNPALKTGWTFSHDLHYPNQELK